MNLQYLFLAGVVALALFGAYLSTNSIARDIKKMYDEDNVQSSLVSEILAREAMDYLEDHAIATECLSEGTYDESPSNN